MIIFLPLRKTDCFGSGQFGAPRGDHKHNGVDIAFAKGVEVKSFTDGKVTKIGYPYDPNDKIKGHMRYVEVTKDFLSFRYFYVKPSVSVGKIVRQGEVLGVTQGLCEIYNGITDHFHFEIKRGESHINPMEWIEEKFG